MAENTGATQQEHNISGAPATPATSCWRSGWRPITRASQYGDTHARTAPLIRIPKSSAGPTVMRYVVEREITLRTVEVCPGRMRPILALAGIEPVAVANRITVAATNPLY